MARLKKLSTSNLPEPVLDRRQAVPALVGEATDFLVVGGLAGAAQELTAMTADGPNVFGLAGAMGAAVTMGLGLALAQPGRMVLAVTGDGELLMNLSGLATAALMAPKNFKIVCVDNGHYGETGNQDSHTGMGVRLDTVATGCGIPAVHIINTEAEIAEGRRLLRAEGLCFVLLRVKEGPALRVKRSLSPVVARMRFRKALLGSE